MYVNVTARINLPKSNYYNIGYFSNNAEQCAE